MLDTPFSPWPNFTKEEADAVSCVLLSNKVNYWTGQECREFEKEFALYTDSKYAVALMNGTVALDLAFKALDIGQGDEVIVTSRTFIASVSSIVTAGAVPIFADVDKDSQNITASTIKTVMTERTKAVVCVHLAGWPCDMDSIMALAEENNLYVIEDCAQAHGAKYKGKSVGAIGHIGAWSFCQDKIMTTGGEGGMVTTNDESLWKKMWSYKDHGKSWDAIYNKQHPPGFRWVHDNFGTNWRMTEIQAVIGRIQLKRMSEWTKKRQDNAQQILDVCYEFPFVRNIQFPDNIDHAQYKCYIFIEPSRLAEGWTRDRLVDEINKVGVPVLHGSCSEVYKEKTFENTDYRPDPPLETAHTLGGTSLMFMVHPTLTKDEIETTQKVIRDIFTKAMG